LLARAAASPTILATRCRDRRPLDAGSAGIPGYDDQHCQELLQDLNTALDRTVELLDAGDHKAAGRYSQLATQMERQLGENCLVVY